MDGVQHMKIPLEEIKLATNNFSDANLIGRGGFGNVYLGKLTASGYGNTVTVKRLDRTHNRQGDREFWMEIQMLSNYKHENLITLVGFCDEGAEKILVYEHAKHGSLDKYLSDDKLSWVQRLKISVGTARAFNYLHNDVGPQHRILHRDIKSSTILLNENWEAKVSDFGLSKIGPSNVEFTFLVTNACGTFGYIDPEYMKTGILTKESDVYSFGVVLFELLCGRLAIVDKYHDERRFLNSHALRSCEQHTLHEIILPGIKEEIIVDSLMVFSMVAYQCLKENRTERPTMAFIVERLEKALELQVRLTSPESSRLTGPESPRLAEFRNKCYNLDSIDKVQQFKIPLEKIKLATNNFSDKNFIAKGGFGNVYIGELNAFGHQNTVAVKRLDRTRGQGDHEFLTEIQMLMSYSHKNLISLLGFCEESGETILVYEHAKYGSLDRHLSDNKLSWVQRLNISVGAARGFKYLHDDVGPHHRVLHRDIKSSNILLNENWEAKVSDFGLSKIGPANVVLTQLKTKVCGTFGYIDPQYRKTGFLSKESDVYSFGVVLFEILCGRLAFDNTYEAEQRFLDSLAQRCCEQNKLYDIILPGIKNEMKAESLKVFSVVAYQCLKEDREERPKMASIVEKLEEALKLQVITEEAGFIRVGTWGKQSGGTEISWSVELKHGHKLQKIAIDYSDDAIHSLMFISEFRGVLHTSNKVGGLVVGQTVSEVKFDFDEEIVGLTGSIATRGGDTIISSLSFETNKKTHGPFGRASTSEFSIPLEKGSFVGLYGFAGNYIDGIGVYLKSYVETLRIGLWGATYHGGPPNTWAFQLKKNQHLEKITINHGDLIYSLMFTTLYRGLKFTSETAGGLNDKENVSEVTLDWNEELSGINGTFIKNNGDVADHAIISSISFVTNRKTYGPFGSLRGTPFTVAWDVGSFSGFYGLCGNHINGIGVYLKAKK